MTSLPANEEQQFKAYIIQVLKTAEGRFDISEAMEEGHSRGAITQSALDRKLTDEDIPWIMEALNSRSVPLYRISMSGQGFEAEGAKAWAKFLTSPNAPIAFAIDQNRSIHTNTAGEEDFSGIDALVRAIGANPNLASLDVWHEPVNDYLEAKTYAGMRNSNLVFTDNNIQLQGSSISQNEERAKKLIKSYTDQLPSQSDFMDIRARISGIILVALAPRENGGSGMNEEQVAEMLKRWQAVGKSVYDTDLILPSHFQNLVRSLQPVGAMAAAGMG